MENWEVRITINPEQCGGSPCIRGMRIRVIDILDLLANGSSPTQILVELPDLELADIEAALKYAGAKTKMATEEVNVGLPSPEVSGCNSENTDNNNLLDTSIPEAKEQNRIGRESNSIARFSTRINLGVFVVTACLVGISFYQYHSSISAAQISKRTYEETKTYDSISLLKQQQSIDKQNETFVKEHEPFVQVELDTIKSAGNNIIKLRYKIVTSSERPLQTISEGNALFVIPNYNTAAFLKNVDTLTFKDTKSEYYIFKNTKRIVMVNIPDDTNEIKNWINNLGKNSTVYLIGYIKYMNYITGKLRINKYVIEVSFDNEEFGFIYIKNYNIDVL